MSIQLQEDYNKQRVSQELQGYLERKLKAVQTMPIQELYNMPVVKKNDYRLYREAIGLISKEEIRQQRERIREEGLKWE